MKKNVMVGCCDPLMQNLKDEISDCLKRCPDDVSLIRELQSILKNIRTTAALLQRDPVTGLYCRDAFEEALTRELSRAKRYDTHLSLLMLSIDDFDSILKRTDPGVWNPVLKTVGRIVQEEIRTEDYAARYSNDQFAVILPATQKTEALILGERIRQKVELLTIQEHGTCIQPTLSGGMASYPMDAQQASDMVKCAQHALDRAKFFGKNNIAAYSANKRRYIRMNFFNQIHVRKIGFENVHLPMSAISKNISVAGLLFESKEFFEFGTKIEIQIPMPNGSGAFVVIGVVVRVEVFQPSHYDIGVSFLDLDATAKQEIARYVIRQLSMCQQ